MRRTLFISVVLLLPWAGLEAHQPARASASPAVSAEPDPTTPDEVFDQMKRSFRADRTRGAHLRYQFNLSDPEAGKYWVQIDDGAYKMGTGTIDHPDVTLICTGADWVQLSNGTLGGFQAFFTGRLKIVGNQFTAHRLDEIFP